MALCPNSGPIRFLDTRVQIHFVNTKKIVLDNAEGNQSRIADYVSEISRRPRFTVFWAKLNEPEFHLPEFIVRFSHSISRRTAFCGNLKSLAYNVIQMFFSHRHGFFDSWQPWVDVIPNSKSTPHSVLCGDTLIHLEVFKLIDLSVFIWQNYLLIWKPT